MRRALGPSGSSRSAARSSSVARQPALPALGAADHRRVQEERLEAPRRAQRAGSDGLPRAISLVVVVVVAPVELGLGRLAFRLVLLGELVASPQRAAATCSSISIQRASWALKVFAQGDSRMARHRSMAAA